jgi:hypothetical protein
MGVNSGAAEASQRLDTTPHKILGNESGGLSTLRFSVTQHLPMPATVAALAAAVALMLGGCSASDRKPYAQTYESALQRYHGSDTIAESALQRFAAYFTHQAYPDGEGTAEGQPVLHAADLYADDLYFSDTLLTSEDKDQVVRHLEGMRTATQQLKVQVLDKQQTGADAYLVWKMTATFVPVRKTVTSHSVGVTHLRFNEAGEIVLHQDFWDASAGFYEHIPALGSIIRSINGRFYE